MSVKPYQEKLKDLLEVIITEEVVPEWRTKMGVGLYSPRVDVAVGPFGMEAGHDCIPKYDRLCEINENLMKRMVQQHLENLAVEHDVDQKMHYLRWTNPNSRCFMAIEIENRSIRKHLMGGGVNAIALGRIGIAVGYTDEMHRAFLNLYRYFEFLREVGKPTINNKNLLIISKDQLIDILEHHGKEIEQ
jgi:hypothetical protein